MTLPVVQEVQGEQEVEEKPTDEVKMGEDKVDAAITYLIQQVNSDSLKNVLTASCGVLSSMNIILMATDNSSPLIVNGVDVNLLVKLATVEMAAVSAILLISMLVSRRVINKKEAEE